MNWISVEDSRPEATIPETRFDYRSKIILMAEGPHLYVGHYEVDVREKIGRWIRSPDIYEIKTAPTHWMPAPELPKETDENMPQMPPRKAAH